MDGLESKLRSNIWKYYLYRVFSGMFFSVPIMVLFWQNNGLTLTAVMLLQSIYAVVYVALDIPTGYFADIYGRKLSLILSGVSIFAGISVYSLGHNFAQFLVAEILLAIGTSFASGTASAFIYETLADLKEEQNYKKVWGHAFFVSMIALALSGIIGGFIAKIDLRYTIYLSIPFFAMLIPIALSMHEPKRHKLIFGKGYIREIFRIIKASVVKNENLKWLILYSGVVYAFTQAALWLYQPYFKLSGVDVAYFGIVFACFQIVAAFSSKYAHKLEEKLSQKYSLAMLIFLVSVSYFLMSNFVFLFSFSFSFIQQFVRGFREVVVNDYINKITTSDIRATVLSAESFVGRLLYAVIIPIVGYIADAYSLVQALTVLAFTTLILGIIFLATFRKYRIA